MHLVNAKIINLLPETGQIEVSYDGMPPVAIEMPYDKAMNRDQLVELLRRYAPRVEIIKRHKADKAAVNYSVIEDFMSKADGENIEISDPAPEPVEATVTEYASTVHRY